MKPLEKWKPSALKLFVAEWQRLKGHSLTWPTCCHMAIDAWKVSKCTENPLTMICQLQYK